MDLNIVVNMCNKDKPYGPKNRITIKKVNKIKISARLASAKIVLVIAWLLKYTEPKKKTDCKII
jgi:hypothetical protein